jgi:hypothetical protein
MKHLISSLVLAATVPGTCGALNANDISFNKHIRPILADRCFSCHGPDSATRKANLRLDLEENAKTALSSGVTAVVPGKPEESAVMQRLIHSDPDEVMPPRASKLTVSPGEIAQIRKWIAQGAKWERHWAFLPPESIPPPSKGDHPWPRNEIDHFILETLAEHGLKPSPPASRARLLRRVTLDLTGLPPTIGELNDFLSDKSDNAYEKVIDRLLASPAFGERMALEWLDVARYGDTDGLFEDHPRTIYAWRDWVVTAFNNNLPYRDFITWQLAGDLLPGATSPQKVATGFLRNNPTSNEGGIIDEDYRIKYLVDRVNTTSTAFLGLTMECAQCHKHKFDPMTQREYYELAAFFNSLVGRGNTKGATAPTTKLPRPGQEKRLREISTELSAAEKTLLTTPPGLQAAFTEWVESLDQPVTWTSPKIISSSHPKTEGEPNSGPPPSKVRGRFVRIALPKGHKGYLTLSEVEVYSAQQNVALAGEARQSSTAHNAPAAKAIDGKADGSFGSCSCSNEQQDAWWELDLGHDTPIDHIVIYNRDDCCPERLDNASITLLDANRKTVVENQIGDAPFRTVVTHNPEAPDPKHTVNTYEIVLELPPPRNVLAAIQFTSESPGLLQSVRAEILGSSPRELKLHNNSKRKVGPGQEDPIAHLEIPTQLAKDERLKLTITGADISIQVTSHYPSAANQKIPKERDKRLAHFRGIWPGFEEIRKRRDALKGEKTQIEKSAVVSMVAADEGNPRKTHILMRGEYDKPGELVNPAAPGSIFPFSDKLPPTRLGLARWMTDPANPLPARVAVNRYWQLLFGTGIVATSEDFGAQGDHPSHQALLDYLAVSFLKSDWNIKALLHRIVTSATYRQSSVRKPQLAERDPENRLLARAPRQRLQAEFIRDHALAVSGLLVDKRGGAGVHPYQPAVLFGRNAIGAAGASFKQGSGDDLYRRSLYTYWKRQIPAANMRILGANGRNACRTRRERTNTPLQALVLLNDPQFVEAARVLAERIMKEGGADIHTRLAFAFRLSTSRLPSPAELSILHAEFNNRLKEFKASPEATKAYLDGGGARKPDPALDSAELAAFAALCSLILNLDESLSKS